MPTELATATIHWKELTAPELRNGVVRWLRKLADRIESGEDVGEAFEITTSVNAADGIERREIIRG